MKCKIELQRSDCILQRDWRYVAFGRLLPDLSAALEIAGKSVTVKTRKAQNRSYGRWFNFCHSLGQRPPSKHLGKLQVMIYLSYPTNLPFNW